MPFKDHHPFIANAIWMFFFNDHLKPSEFCCWWCLKLDAGFEDFLFFHLYLIKDPVWCCKYAEKETAIHHQVYVIVYHMTDVLTRFFFYKGNHTCNCRCWFLRKLLFIPLEHTPNPWFPLVHEGNPFICILRIIGFLSGVCWNFPLIQWLFLVPLKGGRWHIIPQLAVYTTYIPLIYCLLGGYMLPTTF